MNPERFTGANAVMLLIDHQIGTMGWVRSAHLDEIKRNTLVLAKAANALNMPVILTSSMEEHVQGPLMTELQAILPEAFAARIKRVGVVDAMDDENFASAVLATGRKNLIMAGITTDVCVVFPAITAVQQGYSVQVVVDACGSPSKIADDVALRRMEKAGVTLTSTNQVIAELARKWTTPEGGKLIEILFKDILSKLGPA
ncbi:MAG: isochorismatase family protein [Syntrophobacterales bacterium]|jgi:nicotinamidase-related amidase|nr:isochorismatase family protein [Syntrophobacterales bacterium]